MIKVVKKHKNPSIDNYIKSIIGDIKYKYIGEGDYARTYYFELSRNRLIGKDLLKSGKYVIKVFPINADIDDYKYGYYSSDLSDECISYFKKLSKYGLIPKIYVINNKFIIMQYIKGIDLYSLINKNNLTYSQKEIIYEKAALLIGKWHSLGFAHGDLNPGNILITENSKVYFIDPSCTQNKFDSDNSRLDWLSDYLLHIY